MEEPQLFFDVMLHLGVLFTVVIYLRSDIWKIVQGIGIILKGKREGPPHADLFLWKVVATIRTDLMGILLKDWFESLFSKPKVVSMMLLATGLVF